MLSKDKIINLADIKARLTTEIDKSILEQAQQWLQKAIHVINESDQVIEDLGLYSAMAKRKLGSSKLNNPAAIDSWFSPLDISRWTTADIGRLILLITAIERFPEQIDNIITSFYQMGDESEHIALTQALIFFAPAKFLTTLALDIGRTNNLEVLAALTLDNPYPASFYSETEFNQMVLKALFLGLAIERVEGIEQRANADLARMGENYVIERENANRTVPVDIWLTIGPFASETGKQQLLKYLTHEDVGHRYYCTLSLIQRQSQDSSLKSILQQRLNTEQQPIILKLLQDSLQA